MRDPPGMSDARWTFNPLPGDADSPAGVTRHARPGHRAGRADGPGALERGDGVAVPGAGSCLFLSPLGLACGLGAPRSLQTLHTVNGLATFPGDPPATLLWGLSSLLTLPVHPKALPNS